MLDQEGDAAIGLGDLSGLGVAGLECPDRAIPMALDNGRISSRSFDRWQRQAKFIRRLLSPFKLCLGQTDLDAEQFVNLSAGTVYLY